MKLKVYHSGKPEAWHQLVEAIDEAATGIRNKLGCMQQQGSMAQGLATCMQFNGRHFEHVITVKVTCCKHLK
jgi:hypothetical protein